MGAMSGDKPDVGATPSSQCSSSPSTSAASSQPFSVNSKPSLLSQTVFAFMDPLVYHGYKTPLEPDNLMRLEAMNTKALHAEFDAAWQRQLKRPSPNIKIAILFGALKPLLFTAVLYVITTSASLAGPQLLKRIVGGLQCLAFQDSNPNKHCNAQKELYYYCIGLFLAPLIQSLAETQQNYQLSILGARMRNSLMASIYRKCLLLSNGALQSESTGKVVTLMSNDAQKLQDATMAIHTLWGSPILIVVIMIMLYQEVKWSAFVGLGVMTLLGPLSGKVAQVLARLRRSILQWTDRRVGLMSELINGIQMIKMYAWEKTLMAKILEARSQEARILKHLAVWQGLFSLMLFSGPILVAIFCFGSYSLAGYNLDPARAYTAIALFSLLRFPMSFLPMFITMIVNAIVALNRIQAFLLRSEFREVKAIERDAAPGTVKVKDGCFVWDDEKSESDLSNVTFACVPGSLTMVVGKVGSGKSSLLSALVQSMSYQSGAMVLGGTVAYLAQNAWIINDTLQENVLLGKEMDPARYSLSLEASQLIPDLILLPNGDLSEIGDRGITLSGGQKQRLSMARAVYHDADVYILDDPLSALDSHVGHALFEDCIRRVLKEKTVVLVTNALQYLPLADNILWMENGTIRAEGKFDDLVSAGLKMIELAHIDDEGEDATDPTIDDEALLNCDEEEKQMNEKKAAKNGVIHFEKQNSIKDVTGKEAREIGTLKGKVLVAYFKAGGGWEVLLTVLFLFAVEQTFRVYTDNWVGNWAQDKYHKDTKFYLGLYFGLGVSYALITFVRSCVFLFMCVRAALELHNALLHHMVQLPKSFFDTNPAGRLLNRFSRDTEVMDSVLSASLIQFSGSFATFIAVLVVISIVTRWFAIAVIPIAVIYVILQRYYIPSARELQRIESISRSPIYSTFSEALNGVATIRAYGKGKHFTDVSDFYMQTNAYAYTTQRAASSWLSMRLDLVGMFILVFTGVLCISGSINPGLAGLCLAYALDLTRYLKFGTAMASKSESDFNSVERMVEYIDIAPEKDEVGSEADQSLDKEWPALGAITAEKITMRYRPGLPLVLRGVSFDVAAGEKVGLVGRTGSGKSSLFLVLFRMMELDSGQIHIDKVDISKVDLRRLRSKMCIIPQDPFMFSGSVRHNLDPFSEYRDEELWTVLQAVGLKDFIGQLEKKLEAVVADGGANFSQGQKQLFCLARAMLRKSRILMMDEATASVDPETDKLMQESIRSVFSDCTLLTIAHRLNTIMDSDKVLVMQSGSIVESGDPHELLQQNKGVLVAMVEQTGKSSSNYLKRVAREASLIRNQQTKAEAGIVSEEESGQPDQQSENKDNERGNE